MLRRINFHSIPVADQDRALAFYRDKLGMQVQTDVPYAAGSRWIFLQIPGADTKLHFAASSDITVAKGPALTLVVDDVDAEADRLRRLGVEMRDGPADAPWEGSVRYVLFHDSEANLILMQSSSMEA